MIDDRMKVYSSGQRCKVDNADDTTECLGYHEVENQSDSIDFLTNNDFQY